jgi:hypothetical protein
MGQDFPLKKYQKSFFEQVSKCQDLPEWWNQNNIHYFCRFLTHFCLPCIFIMTDPKKYRLAYSNEQVKRRPFSNCITINPHIKKHLDEFPLVTKKITTTDGIKCYIEPVLRKCLVNDLGVLTIKPLDVAYKFFVKGKKSPLTLDVYDESVLLDTLHFKPCGDNLMMADVKNTSPSSIVDLVKNSYNLSDGLPVKKLKFVVSEAKTTIYCFAYIIYTYNINMRAQYVTE